jgi:hypothetical protein
VKGVLVVLLLVPAVAKAVDYLGCEVWLEKGNVLMWAAWRAVMLRLVRGRRVSAR